MKLVMKFGGSCLNDGSGIKHVAGVVRDYSQQGNNIVAVVSAMSGVTNKLIEIVEAILRNRDALNPFVGSLEEKHAQASRDAIRSEEILEQTLALLNAQIAELRNVLIGIGYVGEVTSKSRDYILSFGEKLSTIMMAGALRDLGLRTEHFLGGQSGIVTDDSFGEAKPLMNITKQQVKEKMGPIFEAGAIAVVTGFVGATQEGHTTTLGRDGSDYTAVILGASLQVDEVWMWKDIDGLMTADPKVEPSAKTIPFLSFAEAMEMSYFGAKAVQPRALELAWEKGISIRVKNILNLESPGTLIIEKPHVRSESVVKAVTMINSVALITVSGGGMVGVPGIAAKVFVVIGEKNINVLMISQSSSEANISFILPRSGLEKAVNALELSLLGKGFVKEVTFETDVCIVTVVGAGMKGTPGVAARVFKAIAGQSINIRMIAQGSSELSISFIVAESDGIRALQALHKEFKLDC
ncbi:MAG: aspartate kinase [archaeon]